MGTERFFSFASIHMDDDNRSRLCIPEVWTLDEDGQQFIRLELETYPAVRSVSFDGGNMIVTLHHQNLWVSPAVPQVSGECMRFENMYGYLQHLGRLARYQMLEHALELEVA